MKFLQQLDEPKHPKLSEYDLNRPLPNSAYKSWFIRDWVRDYLALGLYCCEREPLLVKMLIDYHTKQQQGESVDLAELLPVEELTLSIVQWFPARGQTERHTLLMLRFCGDLVGNAMDDVKHGDEHSCALLAVMRREYAKWSGHSAVAIGHNRVALSL